MVCFLAQKIAWIKGKILFNLFFRMRVEGKENLEGLTPPCLITPNHRTYLDHFLILSALPFRSPLIPVRMMALDKLYRHAVLAFFLNLFGAFPARKGQGIDISLAIPTKLLCEGKTVGMYPEGHRAHDKLFGEPRRGAALLALRTGAPVLPVALVGFERGMKVRDWLTRAQVTIRFGEPFLLTETMGKGMDSHLSADDPVVWKGAELIMERIKMIYNNSPRPS